MDILSLILKNTKSIEKLDRKICCIQNTGGGGSILDVQNGLHPDGTIAKLGGTLTENTVIDATSSYKLSIVGSGSGIPFGVNSENNIAAQFISQTSIAVQATSGDSFPAGHFTNSTPYVDSIIDAIHIQHQANGSPPILGIGVGISMNVSDNSGLYQATRLVSKWTNLTHATRSSQFIITGVSIGTTSDLFTLSGNGSLKLNKYGLGSFTGSPTRSLQVDASGNIIEGLTPNITSGVIAPATTPAKVGDIYVDTAAKKLYFASGTTSSADWTIAN